ERLDSNAVVYGLYQIQKPDVNRLIPIKDDILNCVAERQKINDWKKKMRIPGKYEEIEMVVHNVYAFLRNQHFSRDRMVEYYKGDTWEAINNALQGSQAIWLMGVEDETQKISQFVLEDGCTFRTWKKHIEIIEACKQLVNDTINWQYQKNIINEEKRLILLESLKVVDLAEQVFGANHAVSFIQGGKNEEKRLTHHLVIDEGELDFLIKDCTDAGTFARRER
ncbi:20599_t:CDS:2, partial [Racocetra persica]